jgi:hypothetical protein
MLTRQGTGVLTRACLASRASSGWSLVFVVAFLGFVFTLSAPCTIGTERP